ncbi:Hypothetical predicted protein [Marmota monax]|uniref:Uncharacterized protein n=1 Tax=Marmota monax TaxID=9995 RepID=A0A5E4AXF4_MARMO|nr:hypothetical protein GHT09_016730 [Marmota monax]VTJ61835.1 Hypothetical predicted protein [Marmota monax]
MSPKPAANVPLNGEMQVAPPLGQGPAGPAPSLLLPHVGQVTWSYKPAEKPGEGRRPDTQGGLEEGFREGSPPSSNSQRKGAWAYEGGTSPQQHRRELSWVEDKQPHGPPATHCHRLQSYEAGFPEKSRVQEKETMPTVTDRRDCTEQNPEGQAHRSWLHSSYSAQGAGWLWERPRLSGAHPVPASTNSPPGPSACGGPPQSLGGISTPAPAPAATPNSLHPVVPI